MQKMVIYKNGATNIQTTVSYGRADWSGRGTEPDLPVDKYLEKLGPGFTGGEIEMFRMCEYTTGNITGHYAKYKNRYFTAQRRTTDNYGKLAFEIALQIDGHA